MREDFEKRNPEVATKIAVYGVAIPKNCPMMWCSTLGAGAERIATNSNKTGDSVKVSEDGTVEILGGK